jgi:hypothetical protein
MWSLWSRKYVGPKKKKIAGIAPEPLCGGIRPPLTALRAWRRCSDTTNHAKNITHTQHRIPGYRNDKTSKSIHALSFQGFSHGISHLANTRKLTLRIPSCRNAETSKFIHALSFRGFSHLDFTSGEYKETDP